MFVSFGFLGRLYSTSKKQEVYNIHTVLLYDVGVNNQNGQKGENKKTLMKVWPDCQEVKVKGQGQSQGYQTQTPIKVGSMCTCV